jgi:capsular exopolysaccharide synthesis family protein
MSYIYDALRIAGHEEEIIAFVGGKDDGVCPEPSDNRSVPAVELSESRPETIARYSWQPFVPSLPTFTKHGPVLEQFRGLRSRLYQANKEKALKTILISSGMPSEGKSFVAANLAVSLARNGDHRVLLIDGDLRRPVLHSLFGAPNDCGLSDYLSGTADAHAIMQCSSDAIAVEGAGEIELENLTLIPTGTSRGNSSELVAKRRIGELIAATSTEFDWILIDSPPVLLFADATDLARAADAVLFVVRGAQTTYEAAKRALGSFTDSRILGVVLNDIKNAPRRQPYYGNYHYSNGYGNGNGEKDKGK